MIQTTLFNYFTCNSKQVEQEYRYKPSSLRKQTNLTQYFKTIPKKKNLILDYFKPKTEEKKETFNLVLVDIKESWEKQNISCVKKNMYDDELKYIAISYRWGEVIEQYVETPDYTAHISSFNLIQLISLCKYINHEPDLKEIKYLWIDAISVDQRNQSGKKETVLRMNQIYEKATYILAVPDLHIGYLWKNTANYEMMKLITFTNSTYTSNHSLIEKFKNKIKVNKKELKKAYSFLAFLIHGWSNRSWVISEYQIAKNKYQQYRTPLKYTFMTILIFLTGIDESLLCKSFFSYTFVDQNDNMKVGLDYPCVNNCRKFINFLKSRFLQQTHLDMILISNTSRNEDRFYAILPSWNKYQHLIKNNNTISDWNITNMQSIRLKLHEILDGDDLWDKARLLFRCSIYYEKPILPSFAIFFEYYKNINEIDNVDFAIKYAMYCLSNFKNATKYIKKCKKEDISIFKQNLRGIQFNKQYCYFSIKADGYFVFNKSSTSSIISQEDLSSYSLKDNDDVNVVYVPFFIYNIPNFNHFFPRDKNSSPCLTGVLLIGNMDINRWILYGIIYSKYFGKPSFCPTNGNLFNIY
ncbi:unnamed protein product [Cunninghamella blakesleeana]